MLKFRPYRLKCKALDYQGCENSAWGKVERKSKKKMNMIINKLDTQHQILRLQTGKGRDTDSLAPFLSRGCA